MNFQSLIIIFLLFCSCAGYRFQEKSNPFAQYAISSLSVPMFYNNSSLGNISGPFTKEIFQTLTQFNDLKLYTGDTKSDAVLIGIIESVDKRREAITTETSTKATSRFGTNVLGESRKDFLIPSTNSITLALRIIVMKHPTKQEIKFIQSDYGNMVLNSKIIFNERINLSTVINLKQYQGEPIAVLGTQNTGLYRQSIELLSKQAATNFKDMILYAF